MTGQPHRDAAAETERTWITKHEAARIAPPLGVARLDGLRVDDKGCPAWILSDGSVLYDELQLRRWLEVTVAGDWVYGRDPNWSHSTAARRYHYADANLDQLRKRTYISTRQLQALIPSLPAWRIEDLRFRGVGPRFLKPTPRTVVYVAEEALFWAENVPSYADPFDVHRLPDPVYPFTPPIGFTRTLTRQERSRIATT